MTSYLSRPFGSAISLRPLVHSFTVVIFDAPLLSSVTPHISPGCMFTAFIHACLFCVLCLHASFTLLLLPSCRGCHCRTGAPFYSCGTHSLTHSLQSVAHLAGTALFICSVYCTLCGCCSAAVLYLVAFAVQYFLCVAFAVRRCCYC